MATFDERASDWDTPDRIARAESVASVIRSVVEIPPGTRAIEVGAGTGLLGLALLPAFGALLLADTSTGMLAEADRKIRDRGIPNAATVLLDLTADPPPAGAPFDLVLSLLLLHHVEDTAAALRAMAALIEPEGRLVAVDLDTEDGTFHDADAPGIHHQGFDRRRLAELAAAAGFVDVAMATAGEIEREGRTYPLFLLTARRTGGGAATS
jgi:ubiquinone/menaquinone biosynthesis C-methylase UbiE